MTQADVTGVAHDISAAIQSRQAASPEGGETVPLVAQLTATVDPAAEATAINDFIYASPDITDCFLVTTSDGNVLINAGTAMVGERHRERFAKVSDAPLRAIILTQSHTDHIGGLPALAQEGVPLITQARFKEIADSRRDLAEFWQARKDRVLSRVLKVVPSEFIDRVDPDITFEHRHELTVGDTRFELIANEGGETVDSCAVWLPDHRILFVSNNFGPVPGDLPNLYTIRGERIRSARKFIEMADRMLALDPELVIGGHGMNFDRETFRARVTRVRDAVRWLHDTTIAGMNAGKDVQTLMGEIELPEELAVGQRHGRVPWCVRAIWEEYVGWFHYNSTTELYEVKQSEVHPDLVRLAGGPDPIAAAARARLDAGEPLHALHLAETALSVDPAHVEANEVVIAAHEVLIERSGSVNFFETMWLKSCVDEARERLPGA